MLLLRYYLEAYSTGEERCQHVKSETHRSLLSEDQKTQCGYTQQICHTQMFSHTLLQF